MSPNSIDAGRLQQAHLRRDFGDSALGRLGDRSVAVSQPGGARAGGRGRLGGVSALASRALDAVTPSSVRAQGKYRRGVQAFSRSLGDVLGHLQRSNGTVDAHRLAGALADLVSKGAAVEKRGTDLPDLLEARIGVHLDKLKADDLVAIRKSLQDDGIVSALESLGEAETHGGGLAVGKLNTMVADRLRAVVTDEARRGIAKRLEQAVDAAAQGRKGESFEFVYSAVAGGAGNATNTLVNAGLLPNTAAASETFRQGLIKEVMTSLPQPDVRDLVRRVPTEDLKALLDVKSDAPGMDVIDGFLRGEVRRRHDEYTAKTANAVADLVKDGAVLLDHSKDLPRFTEAVSKVAKSWGELTRHCDTHGRPVDDRVEAGLKQLVSVMETELRPDTLPLATLDDRQLQSLREVCESLGIKAPQSAIAGAVEERLAAAQTPINIFVSDVAQALRDGDHGTALRALKDLKDNGDRMMELATTLGQKVDDADKRFDFRREMLGNAVRALPEAEMTALWDALYQPETRTLVQELGGVGQEILNIEEDLGRALFDTGLLLNDLGDVCTDALKEKGVSLRDLPEEGQQGRADLTSQWRQAIRQTFRVDIPPNERLSPIVFERTFPELERHVAQELARDPSASEMRPWTGERGSTQVTEVFGNDLMRANYTINGENNTSLSDSVYPTADDKIQWAADRLSEVAKTPEQLKGVSLYASQAGAASVAKSLFESGSPLTLADGARVSVLASGEASTHYDIRGDKAGNVVVRIDHTMHPPYVMPLKENGDTAAEALPIALDASKSIVRFAMEIVVDANGRASLRPPVAIHADLPFDPAERKWPREEVAAALTGPRSGPVWSTLLAAAEKASASENVRFLQDVERFSANPTAKEARVLVDRYIKNSAEEQINVSSDTVHDIEAQLEAAEAEGKSMVSPNLFAAAEEELLLTIKFNLANSITL